MTACNECPHEMVKSLKEQLDTLIAELQELRDDLAQCGCGEGESIEDIEGTSKEEELPSDS